jgi:hypothetical protein
VGCDARADGLDDAPSSGHGSDGHGGVAAEDDPPGDLVLSEEPLKAVMAGFSPLFVAGGGEEGDDDAHRLLGVVGAVAEGVKAGRDELEMAEAALGFVSLGVTGEPADGSHEEGGNEVEEGSPENGLKRGKDAGGNNRGNGVRGVVKAVEEVENERNDDEDIDKLQDLHSESQPFLSRTRAR